MVVDHVKDLVDDTVGYFDISTDIDPASGKTNKSLPYPSLGAGGGTWRSVDGSRVPIRS